jgi:hypothetical protein
MIKQMQYQLSERKSNPHHKKNQSMTSTCTKIQSSTLNARTIEDRDCKRLNYNTNNNYSINDKSLASTLYDTHRFSDREDAIIENLKYFVKNSPNVKLALESVDRTRPSVVFSCKDYLMNDKVLYNSIYNDNHSLGMKGKHQNQSQRNFSRSCSHFFSYRKPSNLEDNGKI